MCNSDTTNPYFNTELDAPKLTVAASAYVLLIYLLREANVHRLFTIEHVTRGKFYLMPEVPLWQKLRRLEPHVVSLFLWFTVLVISQLCDRSGLNHTHYGRVIEEYCECWAAMFLFLTVVQAIPGLKLNRR